MMVPRAFAATSPHRLGPAPGRSYDEKEDFSVRTRPIRNSRSPSPAKTPILSPPTPNSSSTARKVPSSTLRPQLRPTDASVSAPQRNPVPAPPRRESVQDLLRATAIPIKRKPKKRASQRLPDGDPVANFSTWLQDDLKSNSGSTPSSYGAQFDGLFGSIDELVDGQMYVGSEGRNPMLLRTRSVSTESMPSLTSPDDSSLGGNSNGSPSASRSNSYRKIRHVASSEDCGLEHPLMPLVEDEDGLTTPELTLSPTPKKRQSNASRRSSTFKSTLTASLKAIKSAAQSVSNYATPFNEADIFSSPFDIRPSLTDDRRPPPSFESPSPALRRYLNPNISAPSDSPAQLHFWTDHRSTQPTPVPAPQPKRDLVSLDSDHGFRPRPKKKHIKPSSSTDTSKLPPVVALSTCIPSVVRTEHASSPPIWLGPDGNPINKQTADALSSEPFGPLKQREPRENRDFLRVFVCEMEMKRAGKLKPTAAGHARMWLPPVSEEGRKDRPLGKERWRVWVAEDAST